eukprot:702447-Rhodomonas_salina.1
MTERGMEGGGDKRARDERGMSEGASKTGRYGGRERGERRPGRRVYVDRMPPGGFGLHTMHACQSPHRHTRTTRKRMGR